ncbi:MAG: GumC family protein, partial [Armatimonadota bacterium]
KYKPTVSDLREAKERVDASDIKDTSMVVVRYEASDPQRAQLCADAVASVVVWKDQYARKEEAQLLRQFVEERLSELKEEEQLLDRQQMVFKTSSKTVDLTAEAKGRIDRISELQKQLLQADYAIKEAQKRLSEFQARLSEFPKTEVSPTRAENPQIGRLREELYQAEALLQSARATYTDVHPTVRSLQAKRDELAKALKDEMMRQAVSVTTTETSNPVRAEIDKVLVSEQANIVALEARKRALSDALDKEEREISRLPVKERELVRLARDAKVCEVKRELLEQRLMDARINEATKLSSVRVVELALEPGKKVRPRRVLNLALGLLLGLMLGVGAAFATDAMDRSVRTRRQVSEILRAPVLTCVPQRLDGTANGAVSEAFRSLRLGIMQNSGGEPVRSVLLSPVGADGNTADEVLSGLAASLAASGLSVVVVDADFRFPRLHSAYGVPENPGLADVLAGKSRIEESLYQTENPRIRVMPAGQALDAVDELASPAMERAVSALRSQADVVLIGSAPADAFADAVAVAPVVDGVVLVAASGVTQESALSEVGNALRAAKAKLLGAVLAGCDAAAGYHSYLPYKADSWRENSGLNGG